MAGSAGEFPLKLGRLWHGGDYNPDQWPEAVRADDIRLMKLSHMSLMSVGIFAWSQLEPRPGEYDWSWLDETMDRLHEAGVHVALATPSAAHPRWLTAMHPEVMAVTRGRTRRAHGERQAWCPTSPDYRDHVASIDRALAERYAGHSALALWHVSNEYGGDKCYCDLCAAAFRDWLARRYGDIETLNEQWWTAFWSHRFGGWDEIIPPYTDCGVVPSGLTLDWMRFQSHQVCEFFKHEVAILREATPDVPVTTNLMGTYHWLDYAKFADVMDVISWDSYPTVGGDSSWPAFTHALMRGLKANRPWLLMEQTPSATNWMRHATLKPPGLMRLWSWQAVGHGADSVMYFQWRRSRGAHEKFHGAVVAHVGNERPRVFGEVAALGRELADLSAKVPGTRVAAARVGVVHDWENRWALDGSCGPTAEKRIVETIHRWYRALWRRNVPVDVVRMDADWSQYDLILAPMLYMVRSGVFPRAGSAEELHARADEAARIEQWVAAGGTFVTGFLSGIANESDLVYEGGYPGPLRKLLGIWVEEIDCVEPGRAPNRIAMERDALAGTLDGVALRGMREEYGCDRLLDILQTEGAATLARYGRGWYAGRPCLTVNAFGDGQAYYVAADADDEFLADFLGVLAASRGIRPVVRRAGEGVEALERNAPGVRLLFLLNHADGAREVDLGDLAGTDLLTGEPVSGTADLGPYGVKVVEVG